MTDDAVPIGFGEPGNATRTARSGIGAFETPDRPCESAG
jgi:hypothetical protein